MIELAKQKKVIINNTELTPTVLAVKKDNKKSSILYLIMLFVIFAIFIASVYYLPDISVYVNKYLNPDQDLVITNVNKNQKKDEETEDKKAVTDYKIEDNLLIEQENFNISNVKKENESISFNITNKTDKVLDLSESHYFMNIYNEEKKLLQRIMLKNILVNPKENQTLTYALSSEDAAIISLLEISESEYPAFNLNADNGLANLTCNKDYETVKYFFNDNKVYVIEDSFQIELNDENYTTLYASYQTLVNNYNAIKGVSSSLNTENEVTSFKTTVNLNELTEGSLKNNVIYKNNTDAKVIKFELEASGYTCK